METDTISLMSCLTVVDSKFIWNQAKFHSSDWLANILIWANNFILDQAKFHCSDWLAKKLLEQAGWTPFHRLNLNKNNDNCFSEEKTHKYLFKTIKLEIKRYFSHHFSAVQLLEKPEKCCCLSNPESFFLGRTIYFAKKKFNHLLNSMQNACTSIKSSCIDNMKFVCQIQWFHKSIWTWTLMILFLMRDWRKTQTSLTSLNLSDLNYLKLQEGSHWPVLHVLVLDGLTGGDAVGYVEVDELCGQLNHRGQSVYNLGNEWKMKRPEVHNQEKRNEFKDQK